MRSKARLTITLDRDLLRQVDQMVDNQSIRNRSHAIESLLRESLQPKATSAVILAGGRPDGAKCPALLPIQDEPLIFITIRHLVKFGIRRIFLLAGPHENAFRRILGDATGLGATVTLLGEGEPMGTAGAVKATEEKLDKEPFLVVHGDVVTNINLADFMAFHRQENCLATIAVKPRDAERKYGKVLLQGNRITQFTETGDSEGISIVNTGVYLLQPEVLSLIDTGQPAQFERHVFPRLAALKELSAYFFQGFWFDIGRPENYRLAQARWADQ